MYNSRKTLGGKIYTDYIYIYILLYKDNLLAQPPLINY